MYCLGKGPSPVTRDGVVVVDDAVVANLVEGADHLGHVEVAVVHEDFLVVPGRRQRPPHVAEVDVKQLVLASEVSDTGEDVLARLVARAHAEGDAVVPARDFGEQAVEIGETAEDLGATQVLVSGGSLPCIAMRVLLPSITGTTCR